MVVLKGGLGGEELISEWIAAIGGDVDARCRFFV